MKTLVLGATGATGKHMVQQLITMGQSVKAIIRSPEKVSEDWKNNQDITIIKKSISEVSLDEMADYLQDCDAVASCLGHNHHDIEWVAVRPDSLINEDKVTDYILHPSPIRSPVFDAGQTSRINIGNFMARLITEDDLWQEWRGQMMVVYNVEKEYL